MFGYREYISALHSLCVPVSAHTSGETKGRDEGMPGKHAAESGSDSARTVEFIFTEEHDALPPHQCAAAIGIGNGTAQTYRNFTCTHDGSTLRTPRYRLVQIANDAIEHITTDDDALTCVIDALVSYENYHLYATLRITTDAEHAQPLSDYIASTYGVEAEFV